MEPSVSPQSFICSFSVPGSDPQGTLTADSDLSKTFIPIDVWKGRLVNVVIRVFVFLV